MCVLQAVPHGKSTRTKSLNGRGFGEVRESRYENPQANANGCHDDDQRINMTEDLEVGHKAWSRTTLEGRLGPEAFYKQRCSCPFPT